MKSFKFDFGEDGFKGFLFRHGEKFALAAAVLSVAIFYSRGATVKRIDKSQTPSKLLELANRCRSHIDKAENAKVYKEHRVPLVYHENRVVAGRKQTKYVPFRPLNWPFFHSQKKRTDPNLLPPVYLEVTPLMISINLNNERRKLIDPLGDLDDFTSMVIPKTPKKEKPKRRPRRRNGGPGLPEELPPETTTGMLDPTDNSIELSEELEDSIEGHVPSEGGIHKGYYAVVVKAVVEYKKQLKEYDAHFSEALGYDKKRDRPDYIYYVAQRAEIPAGFRSDDPAAISNLVWKPVSDTKFEKDRAIEFWAATQPEYAKAPFVDPELTMPIPPVLMSDIYDRVVHSKIPHAELVEEENSEFTKRDKKLGEFSPTPEIPKFGIPLRKNDRPFGTGSDPRFDGRGVEAPLETPEYKMIRFFDLTAKPGKSYRYRIQLFLRDPNTLVAHTQSDSQSSYQPGSSNLSPQTTLEENMLSEPVRARLKTVEEVTIKSAAEKGIELEKVVIPYYRKTEFSKSSATVTIPNKVEAILAGTIVEPESQSTVGRLGIKIQQREPKMRVLSVVWDHKYGVFVPKATDLYPGAVLDFDNDKKDIRILHPILRTFKGLPKDYQLKTGAILLDVRGGKRLPGGTTTEPILTPGEFLLIDSNGMLQTGNELDDLESYKRYLLEEEKKEEKDGETKEGKGPGGFPAGFDPTSIGR